MTTRLERRALPELADLYPDDEDERMRLILEGAYRRMLRDMHAIVGTAFDLDPATFRLPDAVTEQFLTHAQFAGTQISETTQARLREILIEGQRNGDSTQDIIERVEKLYEQTWKARPETIVRTEIGEAQRLAAIDRYTASGLIDRVKIRDGDKDEPCKSRNGTTVPLDQAPTLAHPKCTLLLVGLLREGTV